MLEKKERKDKKEIAICIMFSFYIFLSFFEVYIQRYLGPINRFYMLLMVGVLLITCGFRIKLNIYNIFIILWFAVKCISLIWSDGSNEQEVSAHMASQIGIMLMITVLSGINYNKRVLNWCVKSLLFFSFLYGILSIPFSQPFVGVEKRQVLTLFGAQNDPNNNAAFLIFAVSIALYSLVYEHRCLLLNTVIIMINSYAIFLTGSRSGFLSIAFIMGVILLLYPFRKSNDEENDNALLSILFLLLLGFLLVYLCKDYLPANIQERLLAFDEYEEGSGRAAKWENAMKIISDSPLFGKGWGGYLLERVNYGGVHNTFLTNLCDMGLFGTLLLIIPIVYIVIQAIRKREILSVVILADGIFFSLTLDAINKRFFWNAIYIAIMLLNYNEVFSDSICIWNQRKSMLRPIKTNCKYIRM